MRAQFVAAVVIGFLLASSSSDAQTTTFIYQGRLQDGVLAADGSYDLQFAVFTLASGGSQEGATLTRPGVTVINGAFSVELDFGAGPFAGPARFLEIRVKRPADPSYTILTSRQSIGSAPYAIRALNATAVDVAVAGTSIVNAVNDASTSITINDNRLPAALVRIKPAAQQVSASANADGTDPLLNLRGTYSSEPSSVNELKLLHDGGLVLSGFARDAGLTADCAAQIPATGAGTRLMWHPCRGAFRFGRVAAFPSDTTSWDDANIGDFSFAGGNKVIASGLSSAAFGDSVTVSGVAGFSAGASHICSGFACVALGYQGTATGLNSVALGYKAFSAGDYSIALGHQATTCSAQPVSQSCLGTSYKGSFVWGDESADDGYVKSQADNEFRIRAKGGVRLRVSNASSGNTPGAGGNIGCDLTSAVPSWTCASSRDVKEHFEGVDGEVVLSRIRGLPLSTFSYIGDTSNTRHMGPVAEDFYAAFSLGDSNKSINAQNMAGVSLAAVKALEERTSQLQRENDALKAQVTALMQVVCAGAPGAAVCRR